MDDQKNNVYAVIMAGGGGTRLWPWSRRKYPKQMLKIAGERTMFQQALDRIIPIIPVEQILVVTTAEQAQLLMIQAPEIPQKNFLLEPMPRGTASVIALAAIHIRERCHDGVMVVLTADHYIKNVAVFGKILETAIAQALSGHLVTLGIIPSFPSTAMGYIEQGKLLEMVDHESVFQVKRFAEKPNRELAEQFLTDGCFLWNSGMFIWTVERIITEFKTHIPDLFLKVNQIATGFADGSYAMKMADIWPEIHPLTIDYGVMEKADDVVVIPACNLGWNDIGSWESIYSVSDEDANGNIYINCKGLQLDSAGVLCCSDTKDKLFVTIGVRDMVIAETQQAVLICQRSETQRIREIVALLDCPELIDYL